MGEQNKEIDDFDKFRIITHWPQASDAWMNTAFQLAKGYKEWLENQKGRPMLKIPVPHHDLPVIFTCAGLALELAFKVLLATEGKMIRTHTIKEIYEELTPETQRQVIECIVRGSLQPLSSHNAKMLGEETTQWYFRILKDKYDVRDLKYYNVGSKTKEGVTISNSLPNSLPNSPHLLAKDTTSPYSLYEANRLRKCLLSLAQEKNPPLSP